MSRHKPESSIIMHGLVLQYKEENGAKMAIHAKDNPSLNGFYLLVMVKKIIHRVMIRIKNNPAFLVQLIDLLTPPTPIWKSSSAVHIPYKTDT